MPPRPPIVACQCILVRNRSPRCGGGGPLAAPFAVQPVKVIAARATKRWSRGMEGATTPFWLSAINLSVLQAFLQRRGWMSLNRREMLRLGAVGAGGAMLSSAASSVGLPSLVFQAPTAAGSPPPAPVSRARRRPSASTRSCSSGPRRRSISTASRRATSSASSISRCRRASARFHVVDLRSGQVESYRVAHGQGSDPGAFGLPRALLERLRLGRDARTAPTRPANIITANTAFR